MSDPRGTLMEQASDLQRKLSSSAVEADFRPDVPADLPALLRRLRPHLADHGISRIGDLTGLDRIGVPVFFACRPNSKSLSVSQGKSVNADKARLGAVMEALEQAVAEAPMIAARGSRANVARTGLSCVDEDSFLQASAGPETDSNDQAWVESVSLKTGRRHLMPVELVALDFSDETLNRESYNVTSIGLAAGVSLAGAILHGLLEVVENNATASAEFFGLRPPFAVPLAIRQGGNGELDEIMAKATAAGFDCRFFHIPSNIDLPTVGAVMSSAGMPLSGTDTRSYVGYSCHPDARTAATSALLEAIQSRLTQIAGARDDLSPRDYSEFLAPPVSGGDDAAIPLSAIPAWNDAAASVSDQLRQVIRRVLGAAEDIFVTPLGHVGHLAYVVRVLVPGLEVPAKDRIVHTGYRTLSALLAGGEAGR